MVGILPAFIITSFPFPTIFIRLQNESPLMKQAKFELLTWKQGALLILLQDISATISMCISWWSPRKTITTDRRFCPPLNPEFY